MIVSAPEPEAPIESARDSKPRSASTALPKLVESLRAGYSYATFTSDFVAGVTVGFIALLLAIAVGIASGVTPQAGIYTSVIAGLVLSICGGSRTQIAGPTGAFVVIVAATITQFGLSGLMMVTLMAGVILIIMGLTGIGTAVKFIPRPVTLGFTNGIAVLIASTQVKGFLGITAPGSPSSFWERMKDIGAHLSTIHLPTVGLAVCSLAIILLFPRLTKKFPSTVVALFLATIAATLLNLPVATIGTKFGGIPSGIPHFTLPPFKPDMIPILLPTSLTVALLAAIQTLLSATVADSISGDRHNSNTELMALGLANIASPFFGAIPAAGAIARTTTSTRLGAKTPMAGIVHSLVLVLILLIAAPLARYIPLATLAAVLFFVAYNMFDWQEIRGMVKLSPADKSVWIATFALTVFADLTLAVEVGMVLASLLYIFRVSQTTTVQLVNENYIEEGRAHSLQEKIIPPYVSVLRIHGPFLFGSAEKLAEETRDLSSLGSIVILRLRNMTALDATGLHALETFADRLRATGRTLLICGAREQPEHLLQQADLLQRIGRENVLPHVDAALRRARMLHDESNKAGSNPVSSISFAQQSSEQI